MKHFPLLLSLLLGSSTNAWAYEGQGSNPGDWKMLPASLEVLSGKWQLRLRNLDLFPKYCSLRVTLKGEKLVPDEHVLFKADRSISLPLGLEAEQMVSLEDLQTDMACIKVANGEAIDKLPSPAELSCELGRDECEHICQADADNKDLCENDHLKLEFSRRGFKVEESATTLMAQAQLKSLAKETLSCQAVIAARVVGGAQGDVSGVTAATEIFVLEPGQTLPQQWVFDKNEAGAGRHFDISRPRITAVCAPGKLEKKETNWFKSCHPLKRSECNWLTVKD